MPDFLLTPVYDVLLRGTSDVPYGLYHLQLAYAEQLCRLHYSENSIKLVKKRLKHLADHGYVQADIKPTRDHGTPFYYTLAANGMAYMTELGYDTHDAWRPSKEVRKGIFHLDHTLELNDVLISAMLLHKADPRYVLDLFVGERAMKRNPATMMHQGTKFTVIPDAYLRFNTPDGLRRFQIEHDMGTEEQQHFRRRIRAYIALIREEHTPVAFTTFIGEQRVEQMREWTLKELTVTNEPRSIGVCFRFASLQPPLNPATIWLTTSWRTPYDDAPHSLLAA